jgi:hypothetical protein
MPGVHRVRGGETARLAQVRRGFALRIGFGDRRRDHLQRIAIVGLSVLAFLVTWQKFLVLIIGFAIYQSVFRSSGPGDRRAFATFATLVASLAWLSRGVGS